MRLPVGNVVVDLLDGDRICAHGPEWEQAALAHWSAACSVAGKKVLDIGAYTGPYAISAALMGRDVYAFEPLICNAERLEENVCRNGVQDRVRLFRSAVADRTGVDRIWFDPRVPFTSGASLKALRGALQSVYLVTIDQFNLSNVGAIKIDVEGGEREVLAGARDTIARCKPTIIIEILDRTAVNSLRPEGYAACRIDERNYLFSPC